jgi:phage host-nuclease inhibitor protein Gam
MKTLAITSPEALDSAVAEVVRRRIELTQRTAARDEEIARLTKQAQPLLKQIIEEIRLREVLIQDYCLANRSALFPVRKSRDTNLAEFGFELTPYRVETSSKKIKWKDVVARLLRLAWGKAYVRQPEPQPDKQALLSDREKLSPEQRTAAGIQFCQDEQFFIRPKPETAQALEAA